MRHDHPADRALQCALQGPAAVLLVPGARADAPAAVDAGNERHADDGDGDDELDCQLDRLPIAQFPRLRSLATVLAAYDGAAELDEGLAIVLAGLRSQLRT